MKYKKEFEELNLLLDTLINLRNELDYRKKQGKVIYSHHSKPLDVINEEVNSILYNISIKEDR